MQEGSVPAWCAGKDWCSITGTAELLSNKWHPVIIHRLLQHGGLGFNRLKEEVDGVSSKVLSESLDELMERNIVDREVVQKSPKRVRYSLTEPGRNLETVIDEMYSWGEENLRPPTDYS